MKKLLIGLTIVLILCLLMAAIAPFLIDLNKYKGTILSKLKPYIAREVDFQKIELTILKGLGAEIQGLRISDSPSFSQGYFLTMDNLQVRVQLLPLLRKQVKVKKIILKKPVVHLARNAEGKFSFEDLVVSKKGDQAEKPPVSRDNPNKEKATEGGPGILAGFLVNELEIQKGKIVYQDEMLFPDAGPIVIDSLDLKVEDVSLQQRISVQLAADIMEATQQNFNLKGSVGPIGEKLQVKEMPFDLQVSLKSLVLENLIGRLPKGIPMKPVSGSVSIALEAKGSLAKKIVSRGDIDLQDLVLQQVKQGGSGERSGKLSCKLTHRITVDYSREQAFLEAGSISVNDNRVVFDGTVKNFLSGPLWDVKVRTEGFQPSSIIELLPMYAGNIPDGLKMKGPLEIKVESSGTQKKFNVAVNADMKAMEIQYKDMFNKSAQIPLSLTCKGGKEAAQLSFQEFKLVLNNLVMTAPEEISINTEKPQFNVITETRVDSLAGWDALVPMLSSYHLEGGLLLKSSLSGTPEDTSFDMRLTSNRVGFHLPNPGEKKESTDPRPGIVEGISVHVQGNKKADKINGKCKLNVEKGEVLSVPFRKLLTNLNYTPDQLKIASLDIQAFQGAIHGSGHYKLKQGDWSFQPDLKGIAVGEALDKFTEYKDAFSGSFSGSFQIEGSTKAEEKGPKHVKGTFNLSQGELKNFNLTDRVLEALFGLKGLSQFLAQERGGTDKHNTTQFDSLKGDLEMKGKNLHFETLELHNIRTAKATDSIAMFKGDCSMESKSLDLKGKLILSKRHSQELAQKASVLEALLDQEKRMVLPVTIKGPIKKPIPVLDEEYVLDALTGYYTKKAVDKGLDKLKEKIRLPGGAEGLEKPVEKILRGLFGK